MIDIPEYLSQNPDVDKEKLNKMTGMVFEDGEYRPSAQLLELADPILREGKNPSERIFALKLAHAAWIISHISPENRETFFQKAVTSLEPDTEHQANCRNAIEKLLERKMELFPEED